ncbi:MAG: histidine phosphatase family protein [Rubinisphaera brasiliensis]|uniref:Phosphoglycerate mutase n=1 Tax=Rubinisphaera brasiliensis (strain ATCC 49424 / DSM 5305 / JCM 21570 / IAM 15109 / NBRC 103401 / IFAM 1448) TaxID=756272 RepID=F0SN11_RUBBR|nr:MULTISPECIES: histidine phosphatase family protein [Rubinisphaera]ADY60015.1 Phosphoglycerate mutase [Rubinisphaera brasiliensis DSM 5305]MBR9802723.1 histidine phosphatase family protein [bacterium]
MSQIYLVRPGQTDFDVQNRIQGALDMPLNEEGLREVESLAEMLSQQPIDLILSGPNDPSSGTAEILAERLDVPHKTCEGLRNLSQGLWEGLEVDEVKRKFPSVYRHWEDSPIDVSIPNAEPTREAAVRVQKVLRKYTRKVPAVLIVAAEPLATLVACVVEGRKLCLQCSAAEKERCSVQQLVPGA